ncbi:MAG: hypothetical protein ACP5MG_09295 [Verrucomicrobiia bacterium]
MLSIKKQFPYILGLPLLPARRVIAIDAGSRNIKIVLAQKFLNRVCFVRREVIELPGYLEGSNLSQSTIKDELSNAIESLGHYPVAISLSQHLTLSQVIDLPPAAESDVKRLIQGEAHRIAGLSQTKIIWDYAPLRPYGRHSHSFWVTLSQEEQVFNAIDNFGIEREEVCGVTSVGNALIASYLHKFPETVSTVLVEFGVRSTTVAVLYEGQGVYATSFALGIELLAESLASSLGCSVEDAIENYICKKNLFFGGERSELYCSLIDGWLQELYRIVGEWISDNPELRLDLRSFQFVLCGGTKQPGLIEYLNRKPDNPHFIQWHSDEDEGEDGGESYPPGFFAVAEGVGLQALGAAAQSASLLPEELKAAWQKQKIANVIQSVCILLVFILLFMLGVGTWSTIYAAREKAELRAQIEQGLKLADQLAKSKEEVLKNYEKIRLALNRKQMTIDTIQTLELIAQARSNKPMWFVLFADEQTYFSAPPISSTNEPPQTNVMVFIGPQLPMAELTATNKVFVRPGFVAEVCIPEEGEAMRKTLSQLVTALKQDARFKNVDTIPNEQRRLLADQRTILPEKHFAIFMELATNEFQPLLTATNEAAAAAATQPAATPGGAIIRQDKTVIKVAPPIER